MCFWLPKSGPTVLAALLVAGCSGSLPELNGQPGSTQVGPQAAAPTAPGASTLPSGQTQTPSTAVGAPTTGNEVPLVAPLNEGVISSASKAVADDRNTITALKTGNIVLFSSSTGFDGQRVNSASIGLPAKIRDRTNNGRYEIMTIDGPRWVAANEVELAAKPTDSLKKK